MPVVNFTGPDQQTSTNTADIAANTASITALTARIDNRDQKDSVRAVSLTNLTLSGTQTVDGVALVAGNRVGALGQTAAADSGIYVVAVGAWTRATDADTSAKVTSGMFFLVDSGTAHKGEGYVLTTPDPIVLGTTALTFTKFSSSLALSGSTPTSGGTAATAGSSGLASDAGHAHGPDAQTATNTAAIALKADLSYTLNDQTGTSYTLVLSDAGKLVTLSNAAAIALTIPANASVAYPVGTIIAGLQKGAGQVTVGITSDTLNGPGLTLKTRAQWSRFTLEKIASTTWVISGDLAVV